MMVLPYEPESMTAAQARVTQALTDRFPETTDDATDMGLQRRHVFDFGGGLRVVVMRSRYVDTGRVYVAVTAYRVKGAAVTDPHVWSATEAMSTIAVLLGISACRLEVVDEYPGAQTPRALRLTTPWPLDDAIVNGTQTLEDLR